MTELLNEICENKNIDVQDLTTDALKTSKLCYRYKILASVIKKPINQQIIRFKYDSLAFPKLILQRKLIALKKFDLAVDLFFLIIKLDMRNFVLGPHKDANVDFLYNHLQRRIDNNIGNLEDNRKRQKNLLGLAQDIEIANYYQSRINSKLATLDKLDNEENLISQKIEAIKLQTI